MKAVVCKAWGPPESLRVEELPTPEPRAGEVRIDVRAASVNYPDVLIIQKKYQVQPPLPFTPGSEVAGVVSALGEGVAHVKVGDRVIAFTGLGGFAEQLVAPAAQVIPIPRGVPDEVAASFTLVYGTSYHALVNRGRLQEGQTLLVLGAAGGVGLAAVEIGKALGARVIAAASSPAKLEVCRAHGADVLIDYTQQDLREALKAATEGRGLDMVYDPVGGAFAEPAIRSLAWRGRYLIIGFAAGEIPKIALNLALLKELELVGVYWGEFAKRNPRDNQAGLQRLMGWMAEGKLKPLVSARYPLARAAEALQSLARREATGKVVIMPGLADA